MYEVYLHCGVKYCGFWEYYSGVVLIHFNILVVKSFAFYNLPILHAKDSI